MKTGLSDILGHLTFNKLCTDCENWTQNACEDCGDPMCENCYDFHMNIHRQENDDEQK